jgi:hypothetical protein
VEVSAYVTGNCKRRTHMATATATATAPAFGWIGYFSVEWDTAVLDLSAKCWQLRGNCAVWLKGLGLAFFAGGG